MPWYILRLWLLLSLATLLVGLLLAPSPVRAGGGFSHVQPVVRDGRGHMAATWVRIDEDQIGGA